MYQELRRVEGRLDSKIDEVDKRLGTKIEEVERHLGSKVEAMGTQLSDKMDKKAREARNTSFALFGAGGAVLATLFFYLQNEGHKREERLYSQMMEKNEFLYSKMRRHKEKSAKRAIALNVRASKLESVIFGYVDPAVASSNKAEPAGDTSLTK